MKLNINITKSNSELFILDYTEYRAVDEAFLPALLNFSKDEVASIDIVVLNKLSDDEVKVVNISETSNYSIPINFDGNCTLYHIVVPTYNWVYSDAGLTWVNLTTLFNVVFYVNKGKLYKYKRNKDIEGGYDELVDPSILLMNLVGVPALNYTYNFVSICNIQKCYLNLCKQIFELKGFSQCWNKSEIDKELIYKRDLVWMALNVIKYLVECDQLYEAERIIELLHSCNGVCGDNKIKNNECGCS